MGVTVGSAFGVTGRDVEPHVDDGEFEGEVLGELSNAKAAGVA
jgi:hypothetical protein